MHGKFCSYFEQIDTEDISLENQKTWNHTAGARRCRCRGEASDLLSLPRSQPRGPPYEDWFHETPRARPARLLRTRQREREIHRKSVFDGKAGGGGRRGVCRERTRGVWVPFFERGLLHRARGSTVTQTEPSGLATCCKTRGKDQDAMHTISSNHLPLKILLESRFDFSDSLFLASYLFCAR